MAGQIRLFEKVDGLLVEVPSSVAADVRAGRRVGSMSVVIDVLWTAEEEAARDAEEARFAQQRRSAEAEATEAEKRRAAARAKLEAMGISAEDLRDALR